MAETKDALRTAGRAEDSITFFTKGRRPVLINGPKKGFRKRRTDFQYLSILRAICQSKLSFDLNLFLGAVSPLETVDAVSFADDGLAEVLGEQGEESSEVWEGSTDSVARSWWMRGLSYIPTPNKYLGRSQEGD